MAIQFEVENGTGKSDATSYVSVAEFEQYWLNKGVDYTGASYPDTTIQAWLNIATEYIDEHYAFYGYATDYDTQALQWPRTGLRDNKGNLIDGDDIPTELKNAVFRMAREAISGTVDLEAKRAEGVQSKRIGPVSITYKTGWKQDYQFVNRTIKHLVKNFAAMRTTSG